MTRHRYYYRSFRKEDLRYMDLLDEQDAARAAEELLADLTLKQGKRKSCVTIFYKGEPLFIAGYFESSPGVAQVFVIPDRRIFEYPKAFVRSVVRWRAWVESRPWCETLETLSIGAKLIDRWMEGIGFSCVEDRKGYTGAEQDYKLWRRVKLDGTWRPA